MQYRVRPGYTHGMFKQFGPGDLVELDETAAAGFLDKLEPVTPPAKPVTSAPTESASRRRPKNEA